MLARVSENGAYDGDEDSDDDEAIYCGVVTGDVNRAARSRST